MIRPAVSPNRLFVELARAGEVADAVVAEEPEEGEEDFGGGAGVVAGAVAEAVVELLAGDFETGERLEVR